MRLLVVGQKTKSLSAYNMGWAADVGFVGVAGVPEKQKFLQNFVVIADNFDFNGSIP